MEEFCRYSLQRLKTIQCTEEFSGIEQICPRKDGLTWIAQIEKVSLIDSEGRELRIAKEANKPIAVFPDGKLLATRKSRTIIQINEDGTNRIFAEFRAHVHSIYVGESTILVALWDYKEEPQYGFLVRMDLHGQEIQQIKQRPNGACLCLMPKYVIENGDDIWLTDTDVNTNEVLVIDKGGRYKFSYDGRENTDTQLGGITAGQHSNVVIAYYDFHQLHNSIHVINRQGNLLQKIPTVDFGIECPLALSFDGQDRLFVGELGIGTIYIFSLVKDKLFEQN